MYVSSLHHVHLNIKHVQMCVYIYIYLFIYLFMYLCLYLCIYSNQEYKQRCVTYIYICIHMVRVYPALITRGLLENHLLFGSMI